MYGHTYTYIYICIYICVTYTIENVLMWLTPYQNVYYVWYTAFDLDLLARFLLEGYSRDFVKGGKHLRISGQELVHGEAPNRLQNILNVQVDDCSFQRKGCHGDERPAISFDFTQANQYNKMMDMAVIIFIIICMVV